MKLENKVSIITGAGRGIGRAIALAFAREGAKVVLSSRTKHELEETLHKVKELDGEGIIICADISNREDVEKLIHATIQHFSTVHILVNNAGILGPIGPLYKNNIDEWIKTIHVNLIGTFLCSRAVLPYMIRQSWGRIINLSGGGAALPFPMFSAYSASKAAIVRLTENLAHEVGQYNVQVNAIAPGMVNTRIHEKVLEVGERAGKDYYERVRRMKEEGAATSSELAVKLAIFLASEESTGLNGRLISAVHDNWKSFPHKIQQIMSNDLYTLRRVVPKSE